MRAFLSVLSASMLVAASANAQTSVSNEDYLRMSRCAGLLAGAGQDASAFDTAVRGASEGRARSVRNVAAAHRRSAAEQMRRADATGKAELQAEISAKCAAPTA